MKKVLKISVLTMVMLFMVNCSKDDSTDNAGGGEIPSSGWRIGTTNYTTVFTLKNGGQPNSLAFFDALPNGNNLNSCIILFNNTTGIAAGTYKLVLKPEQSDLLPDEIMISVNNGYSQTTQQYTKAYATVTGQTVKATVTITGGKSKIVIPEINILTIPINSSSVTTTFAGTLVEQ